MVDQPKGPYIDTSDLESKFSTEPRGDYPNCDSCGRKIGSEEDDAKATDPGHEPDFVVRIWKGAKDETAELDLCKDCVRKRMRT